MATFHFQKEKMDELGIAGIFLFGSRAQGTAGKMSDYDFAVILKDQKTLFGAKRKKEIYDYLYDFLSGQIKELSNIDIVFAQEADLQFRHHVAKDGVMLYQGDQKTLSRFLEDTLDSYADFAPMRREFQKAILARIS